MPEHKMITIDGIRVRAEDEDRYRARRAGAGTGPLTRTLADPSDAASTTEAFDPSGHNVDEVTAYLATADEAETARVLDAEAGDGGRQRKGLLDQREQLLAQARDRASGGGA